MFESNNREPVVTESFLPKVDAKILVGVVVLVLVAIYFVMTFSQKIQVEEVVLEGASEQALPIDDPLEYVRTDAGRSLPVGFPVDLLLETDIAIDEGYGYENEIVGKEQLSVRYTSAQNVAANFAGYKALMQKRTWIFMKESEEADASSLYGLSPTDEFTVVLKPLENGSTEVMLNYIKLPE